LRANFFLIRLSRRTAGATRCLRTFTYTGVRASFRVLFQRTTKARLRDGHRPARHGLERNARRIAALMKATLTVLALGLGAAACSSSLSASDAWIRLLPGELPAGGYFVLHNDSDRSITLVGASAPDFGSVQLHRSVQQNGLETMQPVASVPVPAHSRVEFRPGGYHLMLMQPRRSLAVGDTEPITLHTADGKQIRVDFIVRGAAGTGGR
jgi:copper(I)-binding protein